jgi:type I restriction enzyme S subunit
VAEYWNGTIPWVTTRQIDFNVITQPEEYITEAGLRNSSAKVFPKGSVLLAMIGQGATRGKAAILGIDSAINQNCVAINPTKDDSARFIYHNLAHRYEEFRELSNSGGYPNLNASLVKAIPIDLPPRPEQDEVAKIGDIWDSAIHVGDRLLTAKAHFKRALMQQLLTGKRRFREFVNSRFIEVHVGDVWEETFRPVEWNEEELYRLASVRRHSGGLFWRESLYGRQIKVKKLHSLQAGDFLISHIQAVRWTPLSRPKKCLP